MSNAIEISAEQFEQQVINSEKPVLVDFWGSLCRQCRKIAPIVDELVDEYAERLKVIKINMDDNAELAVKFGIMCLPVLIIFINGKQVEKITDFKSKTELIGIIDRFV